MEKQTKEEYLANKKQLKDLIHEKYGTFSLTGVLDIFHTAAWVCGIILLLGSLFTLKFHLTIPALLIIFFAWQIAKREENINKKLNYLEEKIAQYEVENPGAKNEANKTRNTVIKDNFEVNLGPIVSENIEKNIFEEGISVPPERLYSVGRKIDWEKLNKKRKITGDKGEEMVLAIEQEYFMSINRQDLAEKVRHISKEDGDGTGYDILSFSGDGEEKYIEVKSTTKASGNLFNLSRNELEFLKRNENTAFVYRIFNVNDTDDTPYLKVYSANDILNHSQITPTQYIIKVG